MGSSTKVIELGPRVESWRRSSTGDSFRLRGGGDNASGIKIALNLGDGRCRKSSSSSAIYEI